MLLNAPVGTNVTVSAVTVSLPVLVVRVKTSRSVTAPLGARVVFEGLLPSAIVVTGFGEHTLPFHDVPRVQLPVTEVDASTVLLSRACTVFDPLVIGKETFVPDADVEY